MPFDTAISLLTMVCLLTATSCKQKQQDKPVAPQLSGIGNKFKKQDSGNAGAAPSRKAPIINIIDTLPAKQLVLYIKDSASTSDRISAKLDRAFSKTLPDIARQNKLNVVGPPIAWFKSQKIPFFFEAGIPIDKKPSKLPKGFYVKVIGGDSAVVAHFFGPYDSTPIAYEALNDYLKSRKKQRSIPAYEVYVGQPYDKNGKRIDPYRVQTDIVFSYK